MHCRYFPTASERRVLLIVGVCYIHLQTSSHLLIFTSSHLLIFTSSHIHIFSSSHLLIFTSSHLIIFSSYIFRSSHLLIFTYSHILILHLTSSDLLIFISSHLLILHLHIVFIFSIFTSSHPLILHLSSSDLLIFTSSLLIFTSSLSCPLALLPACHLLAPSFLFLTFKARGSAKEAPRNATLSHATMSDRQKLRLKRDFEALCASFVVRSSTGEVLCASFVVRSSTGKYFVQALQYEVVLGSTLCKLCSTK